MEAAGERAIPEARLCPACGHADLPLRPPLFIVTGPGGAGKSAVLTDLQSALPEWVVLETDLLWDSGGDWQMVRSNWLRIAFSILVAGRPVMLSGIHVPQAIDACEPRRHFGPIHYLSLNCGPSELERRLRARPAWRGVTPDYIQDQVRFSRWLDANGATAFDPPLMQIDTSRITVQSTARQIAGWASRLWAAEREDVSDRPRISAG